MLHVNSPVASTFHNRVFSVSLCVLISREHYVRRIKSKILELTEGSEIVDTFRTQGGNPTDRTRYNAGFERISRKFVAFSRFVVRGSVRSVSLRHFPCRILNGVQAKLGRWIIPEP